MKLPHRATRFNHLFFFPSSLLLAKTPIQNFKWIQESPHHFLDVKKISQKLKFSIFYSPLNIRTELNLKHFILNQFLPKGSLPYMKISNFFCKKAEMSLEFPLNFKINFSGNLKKRTKREEIHLEQFNLRGIEAPKSPLMIAEFAYLLKAGMFDGPEFDIQLDLYSSMLSRNWEKFNNSSIDQDNVQDKKNKNWNLILNFAENVARSYSKIFQGKNLKSLKAAEELWPEFIKEVSSKLTAQFKDRFVREGVESDGLPGISSYLKILTYFEALKFLANDSKRAPADSIIKKVLGMKKVDGSDKEAAFKDRSSKFLKALLSRSSEFESEKLRFPSPSENSILRRKGDPIKKNEEHWKNSISAFLGTLLEFEPKNGDEAKRLNAENKKISWGEEGKRELNDLAIYLEEFKKAFDKKFFLFPINVTASGEKSDASKNLQLNAIASGEKSDALKNLQLLHILTAPLKAAYFQGSQVKLTPLQRDKLLFPPNYEIGDFFKSLGKMCCAPLSSTALTALEIWRKIAKKPYSENFFKKIDRILPIFSGIDLLSDSIASKALPVAGLPIVMAKRMLGTLLHAIGKIFKKEKISFSDLMDAATGVDKLSALFSKKNWQKGNKQLLPYLGQKFLKNLKSDNAVLEIEDILKNLLSGAADYANETVFNEQYKNILTRHLSNVDEILMHSPEKRENLKYTKMLNLPEVKLQSNGKTFEIPFEENNKEGWFQLNLDDYSINYGSNKKFVYWDKLNAKWMGIDDEKDRNDGLFSAKVLAICPAQPIKRKDLSNEKLLLTEVFSEINKEIKSSATIRVNVINFFGQIVPVEQKGERVFLKNIYTSDPTSEDTEVVYRAEGWQFLRKDIFSNNRNDLLTPSAPLIESSPDGRVEQASGNGPFTFYDSGNEAFKNFDIDPKILSVLMETSPRGHNHPAKNLREASPNSLIFEADDGLNYLRLNNLYYALKTWKLDKANAERLECKEIYSFAESERSPLFSVIGNKLEFLMDPEVGFDALLSEEFKRWDINPEKFSCKQVVADPTFNLYRPKKLEDAEKNLFYCYAEKNEYYPIYYQQDTYFTTINEEIDYDVDVNSSMIPPLAFFMVQNERDSRFHLQSHLDNSFEYKGQKLEVIAQEKGKIYWKIIFPKNLFLNSGTLDVKDIEVSAHIIKSKEFPLNNRISIKEEIKNKAFLDEVKDIYRVEGEDPYLVILKTSPGNFVNEAMGSPKKVCSTKSLRLAYANVEAFNRLYPKKNSEHFKIFFIKNSEDFSKNLIGYQMPRFKGKNLNELLQNHEDDDRIAMKNFLDMQRYQTHPVAPEDMIIKNLRANHMILCDIRAEDINFDPGVDSKKPEFLITNFNNARIYPKTTELSDHKEFNRFACILRHKLRHIFSQIVQTI